MAKRKAATEGGTYRYAGEGIGVDAGRLTKDTEITVRETVAAGEPGAHDDSEDAVVIEWQAPSLVHTENGVEVGYVTRAMSIGVDQFNTEFEEA